MSTCSSYYKIQFMVAGYLFIWLTSPKIPCSGKVWRIDSFRAFGERKFGKFNKSITRLLIISTNLDGFSLANHG